MTGFVLGKKSAERLATVDPDLRRVIERAIQISTVDFTVIEGNRTKERQRELYAQGRTKPGPKVTWTLNSRHIGGHAVDLGVWKNGGIDWNDTAGYKAIYDAVMAAAAELRVTIRAGSDWDGDGRRCEAGETDLPHFEVKRA